VNAIQDLIDRSFDAIIVGAGQAGPSLADRYAKNGKRVALVERKLLGGTCVNVGCTPTKTMIASAEAIHKTSLGDLYGFRSAGVTVDMERIKARSNAIVQASRSGLEHWIAGMEGCTLFHGPAVFEASGKIRVNNEVLCAPSIFLNVGGRPALPLLPGIATVPYLTSSTILELSKVPEHLIVVGGSYVGLEFAQMFSRFGSKVTVVERSSRLLLHEDEDVASTVQEILESEGVCFRLNAACIRLQQGSSGVQVGVDCLDGMPIINGSHILLAVGRVPNTNDLKAEHVGLALDERGFIPVDEQLRTNVPGVWALGDCNGKGAFTHTAYNDYEIVAANLFDKDPRKVTDRIQAHALYIDPPLAQVGMNEAEVRASGRSAQMGVRPMSKVGRAVEKGETRGAIKIFVDQESDHILGASIIGPGADEAIHCILTAMYSGLPASLLRRSVNIHPTVAELIPTVLQELKPFV